MYWELGRTRPRWAVMCRLIVDRTDTCQYHLMCCMYCIVCRIVLSDLALQQQQAYYRPWLGFFTSITRIAITILYIKAVGDRGGSFSGQGKLHHQLIINTEYIYLSIFISLSLAIFLYVILQLPCTSSQKPTLAICTLGESSGRKECA